MQYGPDRGLSAKGTRVDGQKSSGRPLAHLTTAQLLAPRSRYRFLNQEKTYFESSIHTLISVYPAFINVYRASYSYL